MRNLKKSGVLAVVVFALSAIGGSNATAASFTWSQTFLKGEATTVQVLTVNGINGGKIQCHVAETWGEVFAWNPLKQQHFSTTYRQCAAFGGFPVHLSPATYLFTPNGEVHLTNTFTLNVTALGSCHITVGPQTLKPVSFTSGVTFNASNIVYTSSGGLCGSSGSNGTFTGSSVISGFSHDP